MDKLYTPLPPALSWQAQLGVRDPGPALLPIGKGDPKERHSGRRFPGPAIQHPFEPPRRELDLDVAACQERRRDLGLPEHSLLSLRLCVSAGRLCHVLVRRVALAAAPGQRGRELRVQILCHGLDARLEEEEVQGRFACGLGGREVPLQGLYRCEEHVFKLLRQRQLEAVDHVIHHVALDYSLRHLRVSTRKTGGKETPLTTIPGRSRREACGTGCTGGRAESRPALAGLAARGGSREGSAPAPRPTPCADWAATATFAAPGSPC
eukprot:1818475-Rhodomonas_salina.1